MRSSTAHSSKPSSTPRPVVSNPKHSSLFAQTDRLVEQLTRLKAKDHDSHDTSDDSLLHYLTTDQYGKAKKHAHKGSLGNDGDEFGKMKEIIREKNSEIRDLEEKLKKTTSRLSESQGEMCVLDRNELQRINTVLRSRTRTTIEQCAALTVILTQTSFQALKSKSQIVSPQVKKEIYTYGSFVVSSFGQMRKYEELMTQRSVSSAHFVGLLKSGDYSSALAIALKLLSDLIVMETQSGCDQQTLEQSETDPSSPKPVILKESSDVHPSNRIKTPKSLTPRPGLDPVEDSSPKDDYRKMIIDSEKLLATISAHSDRINALNRQISDTMASSYNILHSARETDSPNVREPTWKLGRPSSQMEIKRGDTERKSHRRRASGLQD